MLTTNAAYRVATAQQLGSLSAGTPNPPESPGSSELSSPVVSDNGEASTNRLGEPDCPTLTEQHNSSSSADGVVANSVSPVNTYSRTHSLRRIATKHNLRDASKNRSKEDGKRKISLEPKEDDKWESCESLHIRFAKHAVTEDGSLHLVKSPPLKPAKDKKRSIYTKGWFREVSRMNLLASAGLPRPQSPMEKYSLDANTVDEIAKDFALKCEEYLMVGEEEKVHRARKIAAGAQESYGRTVDARISPLFRNLCVWDTNLQGQPIKYESKEFMLGLAGVRIGSCSFLNLPAVAQRGKPTSAALRVEVGSDGRPRYALIFWGTLGHVDNGRALGWASVLDITDAVRRLAVMDHLERSGQLPDNEEEDGEVCAEFGSADLNEITFAEDRDVRAGPGIAGSAELWEALGHGGKDSVDFTPSTSRNTSRIPTAPDRIPSPIPSQTRPPVAYMSRLLDFIHQLKSHHTDILLITPDHTKECTDSNVVSKYSISHVSSSVCERDEDLKWNLAHMSVEELRKLGADLSQPNPVCTSLRWGILGHRKPLYCVPVLEGSARRSGGDAVCARWWVGFMCNESGLWS